MPDLARTEPTQPAVTPMCDVAGCDQVAAYAYSWPWGASGFCCAKHARLIQQRGQALKRTPQLTCLTPGAAPPVTREERTRLHAAKLAAEEEADDVRARNAELYGANQQLAREVARQQTALAELESQLRERTKQIDQLLSERRDTAAKLVATTDELARVQSLLHAGSIQP
jgi:septal ring factor EnvC (AmiA/AmiB activator)